MLDFFPPDGYRYLEHDGDAHFCLGILNDVGLLAGMRLGWCAAARGGFDDASMMM